MLSLWSKSSECQLSVIGWSQRMPLNTSLITLRPSCSSASSASCLLSSSIISISDMMINWRSSECHWLISKDAAKYLSDHSEAFLFISIISIMPSVKLDHQHQWYDDQLKIIWVLISKDAAKYPLITPPAFRPWASAWCQVQSLALASNIMKHQKLKNTHICTHLSHKKNSGWP